MISLSCVVFFDFERWIRDDRMEERLENGAKRGFHLGAGEHRLRRLRSSSEEVALDWFRVSLHLFQRVGPVYVRAEVGSVLEGLHPSQVRCGHDQTGSGQCACAYDHFR